jgi:hypothetical protein
MFLAGAKAALKCVDKDKKSIEKHLENLPEKFKL